MATPCEKIASRDDHQHRRPQHLAEDVCQRAAHCRVRAKDAQLGRRIGREPPMRRIVQSHQCRAAHCAQHLRRPVNKQLTIIPAAHRSGQRDSRVDVSARTAKCLRHHHAAQNCQRPPGRDHHPARIRRIRFAQRHAGIQTPSPSSTRTSVPMNSPNQIECIKPSLSGFVRAFERSRANSAQPGTQFLRDPSILHCRTRIRQEGKPEGTIQQNRGLSSKRQTLQ